MEQTNTFDKKYNPEKWLLNAMPLTEKQKQNIKTQIELMYKGLTLVNWAKHGTKLGTAKLKALEQVETFAKTLMNDSKTNNEKLPNVNQGNNNAVVNEIARVVSELKKKISKQIMESKTSEMTVPEKLAEKYKEHGTGLAETNMRDLRKLVTQDSKRVQTNEKQANQFTQPNQILLWQIMAQRAKAA